MGQIISADSFSSATLGAPGTFVVLEPPPPIAVGASTSVAGVVGTAPWGPLNTPVSMGDTNDATSAFGPITAASLTDPHDLPTDLSIAFAQAAGTGVSIDLWGIRVSDGTDVAASVLLEDTTTPTPASGGTLKALYSGSMGNKIQVAIYAGSVANTASVKLIGFTGTQVEVYPNLTAPTGSGAFWTALQSALANGVSGVRGPSQLARFTPASSVTSPALGIFTLANGTDGRSSITSAELEGQNAVYPYTGAYAFQAVNPAVTAFWIAGFTDSAGYANMATLASAMASAFPITFPTGTSTTDAITGLQGYGLASNFEVFAFKDWIYFQDTVNNVTRLVPPLAFAMGRILTLSPSVSPVNKPVYSVVGTERNNPLTGVNTPYSYAELSELQAAGIMVIGNPSPGGNYFGFLTGVNISSSTVESPVEWTRTTNYLTNWIQRNAGQFIGQNQTPFPGDPLRASVRGTYNSGIRGLVTGGIVAAGSIQCDTSNNPQSSVAAHQLYAYFLFTYLSSVWYFVAQITGGTTVVTSGNTLNAALGGLT